MELTPAQLTALQNLTVSPGKQSSTESLPVGQQLLAKVVAMNNATGDVTLDINNKLINAKSNLPLSVGQTIELIVSQVNKQLVLQIPQVLIEKAITQKTLRESLPQQQALGETLRNLQQFSQLGKKTGISDKIIQFTQKFLQELPGSKQLSQAQGVKEVIQRSGVFFENKLANMKPNDGKTNISHDLKSFLLQLKSLLVNEQSQTKQKLPDSLLNNPSNPAADPTKNAKMLNLTQQIKANQIKLSEEGKQTTSGVPITEGTNQQIKNALQQALSRIIQQQQKISQNLSRLLSANNSPKQTNQISTPLTVNPTPQKTNNENIAKPASIALKDALAFTSNPQKTNQSEINFSRLNNLTDLLDTLIKQVDAGISRTQLHQLNSLLEPDGGKLGWSMEIPVNINDKLHSIHLHLEKEQAADEDAEPILTVNIALDLENLGPVYARITLIADNVGVVLWAEKATTYQLTQDNSEQLQTNFKNSGLKAENIRFHHGQPPQKPVLNKTQKSALLDVKA